MTGATAELSPGHDRDMEAAPSPGRAGFLGNRDVWAESWMQVGLGQAWDGGPRRQRHGGRWVAGVQLSTEAVEGRGLVPEEATWLC